MVYGFGVLERVVVGIDISTAGAMARMEEGLG